jgi:hypothetical protein
LQGREGGEARDRETLPEAIVMIRLRDLKKKEQGWKAFLRKE